jgi:O-succinylbenzoic acid--CoA ligase
LMPKEREQALALSWPIFESYGLTETASMVMVKDTILPHAEIALAFDGEILVKGQSLFAGYLNNAQRNLTLDSDGYFATGDLGARDFAGQLYVSGRKNNRIISGGENIQAEEVEAILEEHEAVHSALVIAEADALLGHRPIAYLKWREQPVAISELKSYLKERLAGYKCPIAFLDWPKEIEVSFKKPRRQLYLYHQYNRGTALMPSPT